VSGTCEHGNEPSYTMKGGEFLKQQSDCQVFKEDLVPWSYSVKSGRCKNCCTTFSKGRRSFYVSWIIITGCEVSGTETEGK
jgi:hypothetical protein